MNSNHTIACDSELVKKKGNSRVFDLLYLQFRDIDLNLAKGFITPSKLHTNQPSITNPC